MTVGRLPISLFWTTTRENQQSGCAPSADSDKPGHPPSLIRVFAVHMKVARHVRSLATVKALRKDCDHTRRMPRLIWVCDGRTSTLLLSRVAAHFFSDSDKRIPNWKLKETDQIFTLIHTTQQAHNVIMTSHWRRRKHYISSTSFWRHVPAGKYFTAQQAHDVEMTSYWRLCGMVASHRPHFDIITTSCACWVSCNAVQTISIVFIYSLYWDTFKLPDYSKI